MNDQEYEELMSKIDPKLRELFENDVRQHEKAHEHEMQIARSGFEALNQERAQKSKKSLIDMIDKAVEESKD